MVGEKIVTFLPHRGGALLSNLNNSYFFVIILLERGEINGKKNWD